MRTCGRVDELASLHDALLKPSPDGVNFEPGRWTVVGECSPPRAVVKTTASQSMRVSRRRAVGQRGGGTAQAAPRMPRGRSD